MLTFENDILAMFQKIRTPTLTHIMNAVTFLGSIEFLFCAGVAFTTVFIIFFNICFTSENAHKQAYLQAVKSSAVITLALIISTACNYFLKIILMRPRPDMKFAIISADGYAFPSGHTQGAAALFITLAVILILHCRRKQRFSFITVVLIILCFLVPILVGIARMYSGVHYLGDVLGGLALGTACAALSVGIIRPALQ